ncbi:MAG: DUF1570 domain-containing protein, partial [Gemmataceae bacterium]
RLEGMYQELRAIRDHHERLRASIKDRRAELQKVYRGKIPPELLAPMIDAEKRMDAAEKRNQILFDRQRVRFFQRLYHEAFHAYLKTFVSSPGDGSLPIWLNEGMAQIFENAIVEIGELRVGHAEPERLTALRGSLARGTLLPLADLLQSGPKNFQVAIPSDQQVSDRHYLASWALAHYLSFKLQLMGNSKLKDYSRSLQRGTDPLLAFRDLVSSRSRSSRRSFFATFPTFALMVPKVPERRFLAARLVLENREFSSSFLRGGWRTGTIPWLDSTDPPTSKVRC